MTVGELISRLVHLDNNMQVEVQQFFNEHRAVPLRGVEIEKGKLVLMDHYIGAPKCATFKAHDGAEYDVPPIPERLMNI